MRTVGKGDKSLLLIALFILYIRDEEVQYTCGVSQTLHKRIGNLSLLRESLMQWCSQCCASGFESLDPLQKFLSAAGRTAGVR